VSEETGGISVAYRGQMKRELNEGELRSELSRIFRLRPEQERAAAAAEPPETGADSGPAPVEKAAG
jgi:hypothetical protein